MAEPEPKSEVTAKFLKHYFVNVYKSIYFFNFFNNYVLKQMILIGRVGYGSREKLREFREGQKIYAEFRHSARYPSN